MDIILSFDTEDYLTPKANDAQKWWADELSSRAIRGSFQCVGELVRTLQDRKRQDVIESLAKHEISNHSNFHSLPPLPPPSTEGMSFEDCYAWIIERESKAIATLEQTFHRVPISYTSAGDSWTPATLIANAAKGVKVFTNQPFGKSRNTPFWYAGLLCSTYAFTFETFYANTEYTYEDFIQKFEALQNETDPENGAIVLYSHPTRLVAKEYWDRIFYKGANPPKSEWSQPTLFSEKEVQENKDGIRRKLDYFQSKKDIRLIDFATLYSERSKSRYDLNNILEDSNLKPGQENKIPFKENKAEDYLTSDQIDNFKYSWSLYEEKFKGTKLIEQAKGLAWTSRPAYKN